MLCYLPVDIQNGSIYIKPTIIKDNLIVPEGIYNARNWYSCIEVINTLELSQTFVIEQPLKSETLSSDSYFEIHNFSINSSGVG